MVMETTGAGQTKARYLRGAGLVAQQIGGTLWHYTHNTHGDVVQRVSETGIVAMQYDYDAFGNQRLEPNAGTQPTDGLDTDPNPFRYCGEYWDTDMAEYYLRARTYNPATGRFTSEDVAKDGANWYAYCGNEPIRNIDPSGFFYEVQSGDGLYSLVAEPFIVALFKGAIDMIPFLGRQ